MTLYLYNTLTRKKEEFKPLDSTHIRMYVCGPTVYDSPHIGNARSAVVYDVLYRLLRHLYPKVMYVRNITDVDDKINKAAIERGITIQQLTSEVTAGFHADMDALNVLRPDVEPRATAHIPEMIAMIQALIDKGHAYAAEGHVLFSVNSDSDYGKLSRRSREDMVAGARVEVAPYKKDPGDFVLWKPAGQKDDPSSVFDSPWGYGRPGWHIECSAMSVKHLGAEFDIHGGGSDLMFPHHENEIAQSECATGRHFAKYWVHNGFLTVNGEKMSKSLGNFVTVRELLERGVRGEVIRYALLSTRYSEPLDWNEKLLDDARKSMDYLYRALDRVDAPRQFKEDTQADSAHKDVSAAIQDDLNLALVFAHLNTFASSILREKNVTAASEHYAAALKHWGNVLGLLQLKPAEWFKGITHTASLTVTARAEVSLEAKVIRGEPYILEQITVRTEAKKARNWKEADRIREELKAQGIILEDRPDGTTGWRRA